MSLRLELSLETVRTTKLVWMFDPQQNRFVLKHIHHTDDPRLLVALRRHADAAKLQPEGIGEGGVPASVQESWKLLQNNSVRPEETRHLVDWAFARLFEEITLKTEANEFVKSNEIVDDQYVHLFLGNRSYFWRDRVTKLAIFVDGPQHSPA